MQLRNRGMSQPQLFAIQALGITKILATLLTLTDIVTTKYVGRILHTSTQGLLSTQTDYTS